MQKPPFAKLDLCQTQTSCGNVAPAVMANRPECRQLSSSASHNVGQQSPANSSGKRLPEKQGWLPQYAGQIKWTAKSLGLSDCTRHGTAKTQTIFCELYRTRPQNQWWRTRKKTLPSVHGKHTSQDHFISMNDPSVQKNNWVHSNISSKQDLQWPMQILLARVSYIYFKLFLLYIYISINVPNVHVITSTTTELHAEHLFSPQRRG